jgi:hypothetical protein
MSQRLDEIFRSLRHPEPDRDERAYAVRQIPGAPHGRLVGVDALGHPCLLIQTSDRRHIPPTRLENLEVLYSAQCSIIAPGQRYQDCFTIVCCRATDRALVSYFLGSAEVILEHLPSSPGVQDVSRAVDRLIALFRKLSSPATKPLLGLVGELLVIRWAKDPQAALRAWRTGDEERFDFAHGDLRLETKVATGRQRLHHFSMDQCRPPPGTVGLIASLFIERSGGGTSLAELLAALERRLQGDRELVLRLRETVAATLGSSLAGALRERFDESLAISSLRWFWLSQIPAVRGPLPNEVSQVRFVSDLSAVVGPSRWEVLHAAPGAEELLPP